MVPLLLFYAYSLGNRENGEELRLLKDRFCLVVYFGSNLGLQLFWEQYCITYSTVNYSNALIHSGVRTHHAGAALAEALAGNMEQLDMLSDLIGKNILCVCKDAHMFP